MCYSHRITQEAPWKRTVSSETDQQRFAHDKRGHLKSTGKKLDSSTNIAGYHLGEKNIKDL